MVLTSGTPWKDPPQGWLEHILRAAIWGTRGSRGAGGHTAIAANQIHKSQLWGSSNSSWGETNKKDTVCHGYKYYERNKQERRLGRLGEETVILNGLVRESDI